MWELLAMGAGMGMNIIGGQAGAEAQLAGMEAGVKIEELQRDYMSQLFQKDIERQQPFVRIGEEATERLLGRSIEDVRVGGVREEELRDRPLHPGVGTREPGSRPLHPGVGMSGRESGLERMRRELTERGTGSMSEYVRNLTAEKLGAEEEQLQTSRLQDLQKIGLGAAATAGRDIQALGQQLTQSSARIGGIQSYGLQERAGQRQDIWLQAGQALSGLPALYEASRKPQWTTDYSIPMIVREF